MAKHAHTPTERLILAAFTAHNNQPLSSGDLSSLTGSSPFTIAGCCRRMTKHGMLIRFLDRGITVYAVAKQPALEQDAANE